MLYALPRSPSFPSPFIVRDGPPADDGLREDLREFICLRLDKVNPYAESEEYCRQQERAGRLFDGINALLPEEGRAILLEYGEALGTTHYLETALLTERAFLDGMRLVLRA